MRPRTEQGIVPEPSLKRFLGLGLDGQSKMRGAFKEEASARTTKAWKRKQ